MGHAKCNAGLSKEKKPRGRHSQTHPLPLCPLFGPLPWPMHSSLTGRAVLIRGNRAVSVSALFVVCDQSMVGGGGDDSWQGCCWKIRDSRGMLASAWLLRLL